MSKFIRENYLLLVMIVGFVLLLGGIFMKAEAIVQPGLPESSTPGEQLDLVQNLYYRTGWPNESGTIVFGIPQKLGRFMGGYVIGLRYCNAFTKQSDGVYTCTKNTQASGFGIVFLKDNGEVHLAIPLTNGFLAPGDQAPDEDPFTKWMSYPILQWVNYNLTAVDPTSGHQFVYDGPIGPPERYGFINLEISIDTEKHKPTSSSSEF